MTKTINDIKCSKDMVGIQIEYPETITGEEKNRLIDLCKLMVDKSEALVGFPESGRYFRLNSNNKENELATVSYDNEDCETIKLTDFLAEKTTEEKEESLTDGEFRGCREVSFDNIPRVIKDAENLVNKLTASVVDLHELGKTLPASKIKKLTKEIKNLIKENK